MKASNLSPIPKLFQSCVDGRKKGFDQCVYICLNGSHATDSFDGCKASEGHSARTNMMQVSRYSSRCILYLNLMIDV